MLHVSRLVTAAIATIVVLLSQSLPLMADEYLNSAVAQYRDKDYKGAYVSAARSSDVQQRTFVRGMAALRLEKYEEAAGLLSDAEMRLPLIADYAALFQAEALLRLKQYPAAAAKAASVRTLSPSSKMLRRSEKLYADILYESGDLRGALKSYKAYVEKYPSGGDAVDASFMAARCREELGDAEGALPVYRSIWLNSPASPLAAKSQERIRQFERIGLKAPPYSTEELLSRASALYAQNEYSSSLKTLDLITAVSRSQAVSGRIDLRAGMAQYRLRQYKLAEKQFSKAAGSSLPGVSSEARFWLAKSLERQDQKERAFAIYMELAGEGRKAEFSGDAMMEAAGLKRGLGHYTEAARLFDQAAKQSAESKTAAKAVWDSGWCRYLSGDYAGAAGAFKALLADDTLREKAMYWLARTLEKSGEATAAAYFKTLLDEFPAGFYATWHRDQRGIRDNREALGSRDAMSELPPLAGCEKPRLLASLGMYEEARTEMALVRKKTGEKKAQFPALARVYIELREFGAAIMLFMQNRPIAWEKSTLPLWTAGYPRAYADLVSQHAALNGLSEGLVYALIRAESGFSPTIRSSAGAIGLMQMMPTTARLTAREKGEFNPQLLTVPEYNIRLGTKHLNDLMKEHNGDVIYMAAAYNAGSGALERWKKSFKGLKKDEFIESIPYQETRDYVKKVYASAATYRQLYGLK